MDSDGSEFYYPNEMTNENQYIYIYIYTYIGAIGDEENQQNIDVFTMPNLLNYILAQRVEKTDKKTQYDFNVWMRFPPRISENKEIEDITADQLLIFICRFMIDSKKKDHGAYEPTTLASCASCLHSR